MSEQPADTPEIIKSLIKNEELLSDLYRLYSQAFPDDVEFWAEISADEKTHAGWIQDLADKVNKGQVSFSEQRFDAEIVEGLISNLEYQINSINTAKITLKEALSISMQIEESMIERHVFESYDSDDTAIKAVLDSLKISTEIHYKEVSKEMERIRNANG